MGKGDIWSLVPKKTKSINVKLSGKFEWNIELNKKALCACKWSKERICIVLGTAEGIKLNLFWHVEGEVELN